MMLCDGLMMVRSYGTAEQHKCPASAPRFLIVGAKTFLHPLSKHVPPYIVMCGIWPPPISQNPMSSRTIAFECRELPHCVNNKHMRGTIFISWFVTETWAFFLLDSYGFLDKFLNNLPFLQCWFHGIPHTRLKGFGWNAESTERSVAGVSWILQSITVHEKIGTARFCKVRHPASTGTCTELQTGSACAWFWSLTKLPSWVIWQSAYKK